MHTFCTPLLTPFTAAHSKDTPKPYDTPGPSNYFDCQNPLETNISAEYLQLHNSSLDFLPNEILSSILEAGFFDGVDPDLRFRAIVAKISHRWREITHCTPSLWSVYNLSQGNLDYLIDELSISLKRSRDYPLIIHLNCFWDPLRTQELMELFIPHCKRWETLSIITPNNAIFRYLHGISVPKLTTLKISHFSVEREILLDSTLFEGKLPSLRHLMLRNISFSTTTLPLKTLHTLDIRGFGLWPDHEELTKLIGGSTSLQRLTLHVRPESVLRDLHFREDSPIILPNLRHLDIITSEWLSPSIATLSRVFSCPSLESFNVKDSSQSGASSNFHIVQYQRARDVGGFGYGYGSSSGSSFSFSPTLRIKSSNLYYAWHCFNSSRHITTLELDDAHWPFWSNLTTVFSSLPCLKSMIITNLDPKNALNQIGQSTKPFVIPSLNKLEITIIKRHCKEVMMTIEDTNVNVDVDEDADEPEDTDLTRFIKLFDLPNLRSLSLCGISAEQWNILVSYFMECVERYSLLESLNLTKISGFLDKCPDPTLVFPNLRHLTLIRVVAIGLIKYLLPRKVGQDLINPWPNLESLAICGDVNTSRPLLHQIVTSRKACSSLPLKLYLDGYFQRNRESWDWLGDNAQVFLIPTVNLWNEA